MMISNFLGLTVPEGQNEERSMVNWDVVHFNYPEVVEDHYRYRGAVDNNNYLKHDGGNKPQIILESKWGTTGGSFKFLFFHSMH